MHMCVSHIFLFPLSIDLRLHCFYTLAAVNNAVMNIGVQAPLLSPLAVSPEAGSLDHRELQLLISYGISLLFSRVPVPVDIPVNSVQGSFFSTYSQGFVISHF